MWTYAFNYLGMKLLGYTETLCFILLRNLWTIFHSGYLTISPAEYEGFSFSPSLSTLIILWLLISSDVTVQSGSSLWFRFVFPLEWMTVEHHTKTHWAFAYLCWRKIYSNALSLSIGNCFCVCLCVWRACMWQSEDHLRRWPIFFKEIGSLSWSPLYISDKLLTGVSL